jgi:hypothetical protein
MGMALNMEEPPPAVSYEEPKGVYIVADHPQTPSQPAWDTEDAKPGKKKFWPNLEEKDPLDLKKQVFKNK